MLETKLSQPLSINHGKIEAKVNKVLLISSNESNSPEASPICKCQTCLTPIKSSVKCLYIVVFMFSVLVFRRSRYPRVHFVFENAVKHCVLWPVYVNGCLFCGKSSARICLGKPRERDLGVRSGKLERCAPSHLSVWRRTTSSRL